MLCLSSDNLELTTADVSAIAAVVVDCSCSSLPLVPMSTAVSVSVSISCNLRGARAVIAAVDAGAADDDGASG